jgi:glycosyltransferase involved in cell wall biosynthesis
VSPELGSGSGRPHAERVTVVVPVFDDADHLATSLGSLLAQEGGPPSIIVVDDGSEDGSADVARAVAPGAVVLSTGGRGTGPSKARNVGVEAVRTPLLSFLDADDTWPTYRLRHDLARFDADPTLRALLGRTRFEAEDPELLRHHRLDPGGTLMLWHLAAVTLYVDEWRAVGPLDERLFRGEDIDWFQRALDHGHAPRESDEVVLFHRKRWGSHTDGGIGTARDRLAILAHLVKRRREEGLLPSQAPPDGAAP